MNRSDISNLPLLNLATTLFSWRATTHLPQKHIDRIFDTCRNLPSVTDRIIFLLHATQHYTAFPHMAMQHLKLPPRILQPLVRLHHKPNESRTAYIARLKQFPATYKYFMHFQKL